MFQFSAESCPAPVSVLRRAGLGLSILLTLFTLATTGSAQNYVLDQSNDRSVPRLMISMPSLAQSFTPEVDEIGFAAFWFYRGNAGLPVEVQVQLRETIRGPIISRSSRAEVPNLGGWEGPLQFTFSPPIRLVPRREYVLELLVHGGGNASLAAFAEGGNDSYPRGTLYRGGEEWPPGDAWFREGLLDLSPVLETSWGELKQVYR